MSSFAFCILCSAGKRYVEVVIMFIVGLLSVPTWFDRLSFTCENLMEHWALTSRAGSYTILLNSVARIAPLSHERVAQEQIHAGLAYYQLPGTAATRASADITLGGI